MKILKFGGSSLKSASNIKKVVDHIRNEPPRGVVVSAVGGTTDLILEIIASAKNGNDVSKNLESLFQQFLDIARELELEKSSYLSFIEPIHLEAQNNLVEIKENIRFFSKSKDSILSIGERLTAFIVTQACLKQNINVSFLDAREVIVTDDNFGNAYVYYKESYSKIRKFCQDLNKTWIITGFIGSTKNNETTTIGRSGSDYTASIFGAALNVSKIEIWTDVNGILTADPQIVPDARTIPKLNYEEAMELAHAGAKVIFPPTIIPALYKSIPIHIKNTFNPDSRGTLITKDRIPIENFAVGISSIYNVSVIRLQGAGLVGRHGILGKVFSSLSNKKINILLVSQAFSEHSICFAIQPDDEINAKNILMDEFSFELKDRHIDDIKIENNLSLVAVIGEGMRNKPSIAGTLFKILGEKGINIISIAQGSSERNISFIINNADVESAISCLHGHIFSDKTKKNLFIAGVGLIGSSLVELVENNGSVNICGLINSKKMIINSNGINCKNWKTDLDKSIDADFDSFIDKALEVPNSIFVDVTASKQISLKTSQILARGIHVVTANKIANSIHQEYYDDIRNSSSIGGSQFRYETNVGAGLPVIETLKTLLQTGDKILKIEGVLSGTLSYLFSEYNGSMPFSRLVKIAMESGFTEPDPRNDLNGLDVARKILILIRELGEKIDIQDVSIKSLIHENSDPNISVNDFLNELKNYDDDFLKLYNDALNNGQVLRYLAEWDGERASVGLKAVNKESQFYYQVGRENFISFKTERYNKTPLVIKGHGAGAEVTAAGVLGDILKC